MPLLNFLVQVFCKGRDTWRNKSLGLSCPTLWFSWGYEGHLLSIVCPEVKLVLGKISLVIISLPAKHTWEKFWSACWGTFWGEAYQPLKLMKVSIIITPVRSRVLTLEDSRLHSRLPASQRIMTLRWMCSSLWRCWISASPLGSHTFQRGRRLRKRKGCTIPGQEGSSSRRQCLRSN